MLMSVTMNFCAAEESAPEGQRPEPHDHQGDPEFQPACHQRGNSNSQNEDKGAYDNQRSGVCRSPQAAYDCRAREFSLFTHDCRNSNDMVSLSRVLESVKQSDTKHSQRARSEEHTSELQSQSNLVCRLLL